MTRENNTARQHSRYGRHEKSSAGKNDDSGNQSIDANQNDDKCDSVVPVSSVRWMRYLTPERRELWRDYPALENGVAHQNTMPGAYEWQNTIDAVIATQLPQSNVKTITVNGQQRWFSLKVFPDFGVNGAFKGVTQIVEALHGPPENPGTATSPPDSQEMRSIFDPTIRGVLFYQPNDDIIQSVNRRFAQETGYAVRELEGMAGRVIFGDDGVALLRNIHQRMFFAGGGVVWGQDIVIQDRWGREERFFCSFLFAPSATKQKDENVLCISIEKAEKGGSDDAARCGPTPRFIFDALQDGLWEYNVGRKTFFYSGGYTHIFSKDGSSGDNGKSLEDFFQDIYPGDSEMVMAGLRRLLKNGERCRVFYRFRAPNGKWHWVFSTAHAVLNDANGHPARIIGYHTDISEAMRSERNLLDTEEKLRLVFENSGVGIILADQNGIVYRINPAMALMFGRDPEDVEGRELSEFAHPYSKDDVVQSLCRLTHSGRREVMQDVRLARPDGREIWLNVTFSLSRKGAGGERYIVVTGEDVTTARSTREKLQYEATHDVMTGAWNRWVMFERLEQHIHLSLRHNQAMAFCLCDLDYFKMVNDIHGHQMGDWVLIRFVELLKESLRDTDVIARYGGEEFGIIFPITTVSGAAECIERFIANLREEVFAEGGGDGVRITATVGVAGIVPGCSAQEVIAWADAALYHGKESGRNKVVIATPPRGEWVSGAVDRIAD